MRSHRQRLIGRYAVKSPDVDITKTAASVPDAQETREKKAKRNLLILIVIFLALSFLFTIVKNIVVGYLGTDNYKASHREDVTEVAVSKGKVGQAYTVEKDYLPHLDRCKCRGFG